MIPKLCERANETYALLNPNVKGLFTIDGRRLLGAVGKEIDRLLVRLDKRR